VQVEGEYANVTKTATRKAEDGKMRVDRSYLWKARTLQNCGRIGGLSIAKTKEGGGM